MNKLSSSETKELALHHQTILPYGKTGRQINWNKVFDQQCRAYYPKAINRNKSINNNWDFDVDKFILSRLSIITKRDNYLKIIKETLDLFTKISSSELKYHLKSSLQTLIRQFEEMYFLGNKNSEVYEKDFYIELKSLLENIQDARSIDANTSTTDIITTITHLCTNGLAWEHQEWEKHIKKVKNDYQDSVKKYVNEDTTLNVDIILTDLTSGWNRNNEAMLIAFFTATCSKSDLKKLQNWVIAALEKHMKRLDTEKIFTLLEWALPYIFQGVGIDFNLPEIFRPEYLQHISIYSLTLEWFTDQVQTQGEKLWWTKEIQDKLIEQFKKFWQNEEGKIWFWQWSEQLWMRQRITECVNQENLTHYLYEEDLGTDKIPVPRILENNRDDKKDDLIKALE